MQWRRCFHKVDSRFSGDVCDRGVVGGWDSEAMSSPIGDIHRLRDSCIVRDDDVRGKYPDSIADINLLRFGDELGPLIADKKDQHDVYVVKLSRCASRDMVFLEASVDAGREGVGLLAAS